MARRLDRVRDLFVELKRRRVYHVAVIYLVVGAGALQLVDAVVPSTRLPEWADEFLLALVLMGFPIALVLAWAFEMTPHGVQRTADPDEEERGPAAGVADLDPGAAGRAAPAPVIDPSAEAGSARPATAGTESDRTEPPDPEGELDVRSVAVLPFENLSRSEEAEPFVAGLHDDLLTALSKVSELTVISRTSVRGYRDSEKPLPQIARELGVGTLVEGGVQSAGGRLRLNVQLIDARRDVHRWAETYDEELSTRNILEIQTELTKRIVDSLEAQLTDRERARVERPATGDLEAYRLYAAGRNWLDQRTETGLREALDRFERAIERDSDYALAWASRAETLLLFRWYDYELPPGAPDPGKAARRALELDPGLGEAHTSLGILHAAEHDGPAARRALERALELRPGDTEARIWLSWLFLILGEPSRSVAAARRALEQDPLSPVVRVFASEALLAVGDAEGALSEARRARDLQPEWGLAHFMEGLALYHLGRPHAVDAVLRPTLELVPPGGKPSHGHIRGALGVARAAAGDEAGAREELDRIEAAPEARADPFASGLVRAALGDQDGAFASMARVTRWGALETEELRYYFPDVLGPLRSDARFEGLLRAVHESWRLPT